MKPFIFVIDESPLFWNYILAGDTIDDIKNVPCCQPENKSSAAKSVFSVQKIEDFTIANCLSGTTQGTIYKITRKPNTVCGAALAIPLLIFAIGLFYGCKANRELMYRYTNRSYISNNKQADTLVDVNVSFQDLPSATKAAPLTFRDLDQAVQKELINKLGRIVSTGDSLFNYLNLPLKSIPSESPFLSENFSFTRRAIISVSDLSPFDADRIAKITITLKDPANRIRFTNCDQIVTQYQTVNLGTFGFSNTKTGELNTGLDLGASTATQAKPAVTAGVNLSGKLGYSNELTGTANYQQRTIALSASFNENKISFYQEGTTGVNLNGTVISDLTFEFSGDKVNTYLFYDFDNLFDKNNAVTAPAHITLSRTLLAMPQLNRNEAIPLDLEYTIVYRQVTANDKYLPEGYQRVNFIRGKVERLKHCVLVRAKDLLPKQWIIYDKASGLSLDVAAAGKSGQIAFDSYEKASDFLKWLLRSADVSKGISADNYILNLGVTRLSNAKRNTLMVTAN